MLERLHACGRVVLDRSKRSARWVWHHRTKTAGIVAIAAGGGENWLQAHDKLPPFILNHRGLLLAIFGGAVWLIGKYNTIANALGWQDDP